MLEIILIIVFGPIALAILWAARNAIFFAAVVVFFLSMVIVAIEGYPPPQQQAAASEEAYQADANMAYDEQQKEQAPTLADLRKLEEKAGLTLSAEQEVEAQLRAGRAFSALHKAGKKLSAADFLRMQEMARQEKLDALRTQRQM